MEVIIRPDETAATGLAAALLAGQVRRKPDSVLGLATGATMERVYAELVRMHREDGLDFSLCRTFNLDEYVGLAPDDPHAYRHYMNEHLFGRINIDPRNTHLPHGCAPDLKAECRRYEELIEACGGIDLQLLGMGRSGHIGFNEPLSALQSRTRDKALTPTTLRQNAGYFPSPEAMPKRGITMGVGTILEARDMRPARDGGGQGRRPGQGRRGARHLHDLRLRPPAPSPLPHRGRRGGRHRADPEGLLPLDLRERSRVAALPLTVPGARRARAIRGFTGIPLRGDGRATSAGTAGRHAPPRVKPPAYNGASGGGGAVRGSHRTWPCASPAARNPGTPAVPGCRAVYRASGWR